MVWRRHLPSGDRWPVLRVEWFDMDRMQRSPQHLCRRHDDSFCGLHHRQARCGMDGCQRGHLSQQPDRRQYVQRFAAAVVRRQDLASRNRRPVLCVHRCQHLGAVQRSAYRHRCDCGHVLRYQRTLRLSLHARPDRIDHAGHGLLDVSGRLHRRPDTTERA